MDNKDIQQLHFEALSARLDEITEGISYVKNVLYFTIALLCLVLVVVLWC